MPVRVLQLSFYGDHNLGLFAKATDKLCLLGNFISRKDEEKIAKALKVKTARATIANTDLVGMLCCMNSNGILLPRIVTDKELEGFKAIKKEFGINLEILNSKFTAIGNLTLCNDKGAATSKDLTRKDRQKIEDCLGVNAERISIANIDTVGSCGLATNRGCLLHRDVSEEEIESIESILKVEADIGTANFGSPFVGACAFANSKAAVMGESTTGPEIARVYEALGLL